MSLYCYLKAPPGKRRFLFKQKILLAKVSRYLPVFFIPGGIILIALVFYQVFAYQFLVLKKNQAKIVAPISEVAIAEAKGMINPLVEGVFTHSGQPGAVLSNQQINYDLINNWFPTAPVPPVKKTKITHYRLSIPKLRIDEAVVTIGGIEVKDSLVHYPGTALPGEFGKGVIFGHSVLPIFYNPRDYQTIFSLIPTLEEGDKIYLFYDGIEYVYQVFDYQEVRPEEIEVLEQRFDQQTLSLITCVPPGTYLRRGIIRARLVKFE